MPTTGQPAPAAGARTGAADALAHRTLPAAIADTLRSLIIEGELAPGTRLNERALCDQLRVSRTPLREAFRLLAADGLVDLQPNRGARVIALSEKDVRESFEIMEALEALSGELACRYASDEEIIEIRALTHEMQACHARRDLSGYYRLNSRIHDCISRAGRNTHLMAMYRSVNLRLQNLRYRSNIQADKWDQAMAEHLAMVQALEARDADALAKLLRNHLRKKAAVTLAAFRQQDAPDAAVGGGVPAPADDATS